MNVNELETPSVLINLDRMEDNLRRMQTFCDRLDVDFRPHIKTHKIPAIAQKQLQAGAIGIACQKLSEADVFIQAGFNDIQIPYNIVGLQKTRNLVRMAQRAHMTTMADHPVAVEGLAQAAKDGGVVLRVMVDLATGTKRTGATPEAAVEIAKQIEASPYLQFAGVLVYPSYIAERPAVQYVLDALEKAGIDVPSVSGGGTGGALDAPDFPEITELRVGTYIFNDWTCVTKGWATIEECAMTVTATVISRPTEDRAILDSGRKALASDRIADGHGSVVEYPDAHIYDLSEEHAHVDVSKCAEKPQIGELVQVIPVHTCVVTNLQNQIYGVRGDEIEVTWPVAARGLVW